jgi:hypothetical protein
MSSLTISSETPIAFVACNLFGELVEATALSGSNVGKDTKYPEIFHDFPRLMEANISKLPSI